MKILKIIHKFRFYIYQSIKNDITNRFKRSKLGGFWLILNPLSQVLIYTLILSNVLSAKLPNAESEYIYPIYLMAGLLGWILFTEIINRCLNIFIEYRQLIKKMSFPKVLLPLVLLGSSLVNNFILFLVMSSVFLFLDHSLGVTLLWLIPISFGLAVFAISIGLIAGLINVFLRDAAQVVPIILQMFFWFTPIVYPATIIPESYRYMLNLNPIYPYIDAYQKIIVYDIPPEIQLFYIPLIITALFLMVGLFIFRKAGEDMADVL